MCSKYVSLFWQFWVESLIHITSTYYHIIHCILIVYTVSANAVMLLLIIMYLKYAITYCIYKILRFSIRFLAQAKAQCKFQKPCEQSLNFYWQSTKSNLKALCKIEEKPEDSSRASIKWLWQGKYPQREETSSRSELQTSSWGEQEIENNQDRDGDRDRMADRPGKAQREYIENMQN